MSEETTKKWHHNWYDTNDHFTYRGNNNTAHVYDPKGLPWPMGTDDKWLNQDSRRDPENWKNR